MVHLGIAVHRSETQIGHVDYVTTPTDTHEKVLWLDVLVKKVLRVDVFNAMDELVCEQKHSFERKFAVAIIEEIL